MYCYKCGQFVDERFRLCPNCGCYLLAEPEYDSDNTILISVLLLSEKNSRITEKLLSCCFLYN